MALPGPASPVDPGTPTAASAPASRASRPSILADGLVFAGGAAAALLLFCVLYSVVFPAASGGDSKSTFLPSSFFPKTGRIFSSAPASPAGASCVGELGYDPPDRTFYDDPALGYTVGSPVGDWDRKRQEWLQQHPSFKPGAGERVMMLTGSQPGPCKNPVGDHFLLRFYKNKADYCRIHGLDLFYNSALLHPKMSSFWAKIPLVRAAMVAHPEAEWLWWVDSDAAFTDMEFKLPLHNYKNYNLVVHGWPNLVYEQKTWTSLGAGVFLLRNCQWSMDFLEAWAAMGPQTPEYAQWGRTQREEFKDKLFPESDDQSGIIYLLRHQKERWGDKVYLENDYYFDGYWLEVVGRLENLTARYLDMERRFSHLRRRRAEKVAESRAAEREGVLRVEGWKSGTDARQRPFITHFTGCEPCSGDHNRLYSGANCWEGMRRALDFADDQVLRNYGFGRHGGLGTSDVRPLPYDFPAVPGGH